MKEKCDKTCKSDGKNKEKTDRSDDRDLLIILQFGTGKHRQLLKNIEIQLLAIVCGFTHHCTAVYIPHKLIPRTGQI